MGLSEMGGFILAACPSYKNFLLYKPLVTSDYKPIRLVSGATGVGRWPFLFDGLFPKLPDAIDNMKTTGGVSWAPLQFTDFPRNDVPESQSSKVCAGAILAIQ